ncbi:MAG: alpha/beta hydrolase [Pseudomonadaceae bacterium]|uniref:alpha/beta family hydrolase n=1 Tax=Pseudomonas sp. Ga0074129 TaxID=1752219 RepID=UPI000AEF3216|nr:alpha/beta family hydrolase [Pseudomonas sp. Ga0074129]MBX9762380.1 alpha/beta hydrolase [Pseudomonadaceae bacterium]
MSKGRGLGIDRDQYPQGQVGDIWLWDQPESDRRATLLLAHGAGAPMDSEFMQQMAQSLALRCVAVMRFEFAYMAARRQDGKKRPPNPQAQLLERWREVYQQVREQVVGPLAIGGKSMGGRMASLLADELEPDALVCLGYPFYAVGKPQKPRIEHLAQLKTRTLIIQGERDALGDRQAVATYPLADAITLHWLAAADHDLKPLKRSGFTQHQHMETAADLIATFITQKT